MTKTSATPLRSSGARAILTALGLALAITALPASAQNQPRGLEREPDVRAVALTPLSDLNLSRDPIPELLLTARNAPYDATGLRNCRDVRRQVEELDLVLGPDSDLMVPEDRNISAGNIAQRIVGSFIPFRGVIREISGANEHERDFREAIAAGMMRRAYLKGRGQAMGCAWPARPATAAEAERWRAEQAALQDSDAETDARGDQQEDSGTRFVSQPVVQDID